MSQGTCGQETARNWERRAVRVKIVIVDGQRIAREGLCALFKGEQDMEVLGYTENGEGALQLTRTLLPDVVLMALEADGSNTIGVTRQLLEVKPDVRVIGLSSNGVNGQFVRELLSAGAAGLITRWNGFSDFLNAVRVVMARRIYLSPDVAEVMVDQYLLKPAPDRKTDGVASLTPREREVLQLVSEGMSTKEVAAALKISGKTVDMHRQNIMNKLSLHSVAELTKYAIREGITALHY